MRKMIFKLFGMVMLAGSLGIGWGLMEYQQFVDTPLSLDGSGFQYEVKTGETLTQVSRALSEAEVLDRPRFLVWMARIQGVAKQIKIGEYHLQPGITPPQVLEKLVAGDVIQYSQTLVEGLTFRELLAALKKHPQIQHTLNGLSNQRVMTRLGHPGEHPEGRFLPDTYNFPLGTTDTAFLKRAYNAMEKVLENEWDGRMAGLPLKTPYEALILASIVEKETGLASERRAIAGVFIRRLKKRMRLQTDPTVIYGMGKAFDGNLRRRDLQRDTPYNTYRRSGLPPTPIAMPGRDAIHAALNPDDSEALYFVSRGDGSHQFNKTLKQHNNAVIKYQLKGRARAFSSMPNIKKKKK